MACATRLSWQELSLRLVIMRLYHIIRIIRVLGLTTRPCRAPHHAVSDAGRTGGGHVPMPGEVSLAHHGVLFLDDCRSSAATSWRSCGNRSRMVSYSYNLAGVLHINTFAILAARLLTWRTSRQSSSPPLA
jgi:hypothetical protein